MNARAAQLIASARPIADELNLRPVQDAIDELHEMAGIEGLTRREVDILKVVAIGLSSCRIAEAFHISQSTVATHMRNIFCKTGAANRMEAADFARRAGLLD